MRIFIAFPVAKTIQEQAKIAMQMLQRKYPYVEGKWVAPSNMHITLEFLGSITERQVQVVKDILLYQTKKVLPFLYSVTGLTAFPNVHKPQTLVMSVAEVDTTFSVLLRKAVHEELTLHNLSNDFKLWRPHITLARVKNTGRVNVKDLEKEPVEHQVWQVDHVSLVASQLTAQGSKYTILEKYPLG